PYQSGGYCKHLVAVGLAILAGRYEEKLAVSPPNSAASVSPAEISASFIQATQGQKLGFLVQALRKLPELQHAWLRYLAGTEKPILRVDLNRVQQAVTTALGQIDLITLMDPDDVADEAAETPTWESGESSLDYQIGRAFQPFKEECSRWQSQKDWPNAFLVLLGWYEGLQIGLLDRWDEWEPWEDEVWSAYYRIYHQLADSLAQDLLPYPTCKWILGRLMERWDYLNQQLNHAKPHLSPKYTLEDWTPMVLRLVQDPITASFLATRLQAYGIEGVVPGDWPRHLASIQSEA
ncbi:MAG: hypothetical protein AAF804_13040, partial [Bacteroidota bacterium]